MSSKQLIEKAIAVYIEQQKSVKPGDEKYGNSLWELNRADEAILKLNTCHTAIELSRKGGDWLGVAREWMQCKFMNGSDVTWGSQDVLTGRQITVSDIEMLAAHIAATAINEHIRNL